MQGMLADVNVQGHLPYLRRLLENLHLWPILAELGIALVTFPDLGLDRGMDDRPLWNYCQEHRWVLFTENRNHDGPDTLHATLTDSWEAGCLPVLTLANKARFEHSPEHAERVTRDVAELLFGIHFGEYRDQHRIYVPR
jgi:hypothetical protein